MRSAPGLLVLLSLLLPGCAELRAPAQSAAPPGLTPGAADPGRAAIAATAYAFADGGGRLTGRPAEAAQASAQLEYLAADVARGGRWRALPSSLPFELAASRLELRSALGTAPEADPAAVSRALLAAARALRAGDRAAAEQALAPPLFPAGGAATLLRLNEVAPLPQTANTTAVLAQEVRRLDEEQRWERFNSPELIEGSGLTTSGLGGGMPGY
ncbi:hypothetical protein M0638_20015 [Roseomonas sp. NAR14]|uniref:Uncharacterized protein n=1 Tax=Roseomonas acroporae TaxID=2937791 RepID=A0A9X1YCV4_9PROT|nr:hypothetical protein [Roseomonas acroporae]MCK8786665.1 hypothetical protein [Roseomonas acroporae]